MNLVKAGERFDDFKEDVGEAWDKTKSKFKEWGEKGKDLAEDAWDKTKEFGSKVKDWFG